MVVRFFSLLISFLAVLSLSAKDVLLTKTGARLVGEVQKVEEGILYLKTEYAGTIQVKINRIDLAEIDTELVWKLKDEEEVHGNVRTKFDGNGWVLVTNANDRSIALNQVVRAWKAEENQPTEIVTEKSIRRMIGLRMPREWSFEAAVNISGKSGNASGLSTALRADLKLESDRDRLDIFGKYQYNENNNQSTIDEVVGGVSYTNFFFDRIGWFAREEVERDHFEKIKLRSTTAAGLSYRFMRKENLSMEARAGFSYRYENYFPDHQSAVDEEAFPGMDFGFIVNWKFTDWGRIKSEISYVPTFDAFSNYIVYQDTGLNLPLAYSDRWRLRLGLANQYNASPEGSREKLDTSYYLRFVYAID